ncbi:beta-hexosaminidase, partial [Streptomyces solincola]
RHFQPARYLHRLIDLLALHRMNVLHLHLTDDQGWRMPVAAYPKLTEIGGHRARTVVGPGGSGVYDDTPHGGSYTRAGLTALTAHAAARGVTLLPEIDLPGHTRAALAAYPELGADPGRHLPVWDDWGVSPHILGVHDRALDFCRTVLDEVCDAFPGAPVHIGGDECPDDAWRTSPDALRRVADEGLTGPRALHPWFVGRLADHLHGLGRTPVAWAEDDRTMPEGTVLMPWRDAAHGLPAARRGHDVVATPFRTTYLDYPETDDPAEPRAQAGDPLTLRAVQAHDPVPADWEPAAAARVTGTQAQLWSEYLPTAAHLEYRAFPRLCALAESAWSGPAAWPDFVRRLGPHRVRLDALGVRPHPPTREETV